MRIPEVREQLAFAAIQLQSLSNLLNNLERELHRRPYVRKAASQRATPSKESIQAYARTYPDADYMQIANACGTSTGRVSEALAGFRS